MCVHKPYYICIQGLLPCAHTGIHHVYTKCRHTCLYSETRTCLCIPIPIIPVYAEAITHMYTKGPYPMYTLRPSSHICTLRPYHTCVHRNSIITYVFMTLVPCVYTGTPSTGMYPRTCHGYIHCTCNHRAGTLYVYI